MSPDKPPQMVIQEVSYWCCLCLCSSSRAFHLFSVILLKGDGLTWRAIQTRHFAPLFSLCLTPESDTVGTMYNTVKLTGLLCRRHCGIGYGHRKCQLLRQDIRKGFKVRLTASNVEINPTRWMRRKEWNWKAHRSPISLLGPTDHQLQLVAASETLCTHSRG